MANLKFIKALELEYSELSIDGYHEKSSKMFLLYQDILGNVHSFVHPMTEGQLALIRGQVLYENLN